MNPDILSQAEVVLLAPERLALALAYAPGETPSVVANIGGEQLTEWLWAAQTLGIPIVECGELSPSNFVGLEHGQEIPESLFRSAAQAIALTQRSHQGPIPVRLVRDLASVGGSVVKRTRLPAVSEQLQGGRIAIELRSARYVASVETLLALHRERLQIEIGVPLLRLEVRVNESLPQDGRILVQGLEEFTWAAGTDDDYGGLLIGLYEVVSRTAHRLLGFRETEALIENLKKAHPSLYRALFPAHLSVSALRQILRNLLREGIRIRDLRAILEAIEEHKERTQDPDQLTEFVRSTLDFQLCREYGDADGVVHAMLVLPEVEQRVLQGARQTSVAVWFDMDVDSSLKLLAGVARGVEKADGLGIPPVLLCSPRPRRYLRRLIQPTFPNLPVLSFAEIAPEADVRVFTTLGF